MTTEEKLQHFLDFCMEDSRARSAKLIDEYTAALEKTFEEHQAEARQRAAMQLHQEQEHMKRECNKRLAIEQLQLKRTLGQKNEELKSMIIVELRNRLAEFMDSQEYFPLLEKQIKEAKEFAGDQELIIYMDPADENKIPRLALHHNVTIKPCDHSFLGGIKAEIPSRNILIDNSFATKLEEAKHNFKFDIHLEGGGNNG